ncbi:MAG: cytochrome c [Acidimicrobiia bacterium]|nr:cytochrome c [Acidimicrobiia bacterium]
MGERPIDTQLEAATNKWMQAGLVLMVVLVLAFPAYRLLEPSNREAAREQLIEDLAAQGDELFAGQCASCHGENGIDGQIGPSLNSKQFLEAANDDQIISLVSVGVPGSQMGAYSIDFGGPLTLEQITAITTYLRSLEKDAPDNPDWRAVVEPGN